MIALTRFIFQYTELRQMDLKKTAPQVCELAQQAGQVIMKIYEEHCRTGVLVSRKTDDSPLTQADQWAHAVICEGLHRLTPDIPVVSEEDAQSWRWRTPTGTFWLVDPLDGTKEFLGKNGEFTVNIALVTDGEPVWGVVYAPVPAQMFWGGRDEGAYLRQGSETTALRVADRPGRCRVVASKSHLSPETLAFMQGLESTDWVQVGSSLKFCLIASGQAHVYPRLSPTCEWDTAAAQAVVEGAGGFVQDMDGVRLRYGKADVLNPYFIAACVPWPDLRGRP
jgi:3'(2'), 5'-bisphosphate nucleotidase